MNVHSIGDQARAFALQAASNRLKLTMTTLTQELSSGEVADIGQRLQGNTQSLGNIEARIALLRQYQRNTVEADSIMTGMQDNLSFIKGTVDSTALSLINAPFAETEQLLGTRAAEVNAAFEAVVNTFNGAVGGRFLFSGLHFDQPPLISASEILDALTVATAGLTTAADVSQAVADWFDAAPGLGGFVDVAYQGSLGQSHQFAIGEGMAVGSSTTVATPALRDVLKGLATAALVDRGVLSGQQNEQRDLMRQGGQVLANNTIPLVGEMGRIGHGQQIASRAMVENGSALATLQIARNELRQIDPMETVAALTEVETQIAALYAVTARLSKLKLVEFLR